MLSPIVSRADLVLEQRSADNDPNDMIILKLHGDRMRMDQPRNSFSVIVNLKTHDSITLLTKQKKYMTRKGSEILQQMAAEKLAAHGTNQMNDAPVPPVDTGKSEVVDGYKTEIYTWTGAQGLTQTFWVAKDFPNYSMIKAELQKIDQFNLAGPHRNAQLALSQLPGMVVKTTREFHGEKITSFLASVKVEPVDASLFTIPPDYSPWQQTAAKNP